ncbi:MAG TPA: pitrilysin family protein [Polyangiaceae bacterium LLY-WYZ-15_(1-7)]|nr:peptidase M16 [Sandaracinus sp.]HJL01628.1 pitrilysin family protein [Polyangiaceae bacterium LLY-WYZ-15_(1-7)]HJL08668.1 pitrilysin family protein [Polyangiaceae bacterium LLY-WYZ-15_(1-7)]HJL22175.1 pitrilysin family protein [Polyangiaceae bacterium LLY-WYZ-15_(1-7)]HJL32840.1 pitrilysin family protein [Polyangiaceae bacterium LLY-WYZ-15_(1-7)]
MSQASFTHAGAPVYLEPSEDLPLVDFVVCVRGGAALDPVAQPGLARMTARLMRRGTRGVPASAIDDAIGRLGARLSVTVSRSATRFHGTVLARNLEPFVELLAGLIRRPAFRGSDLARAKRRIRHDLRALREDDYGLAERHLRRAFFPGHPFGRPVGGTEASIASLKRPQIVAHHAATVRARNLVFGAAGAIDADGLRGLLERHFADLPGGARPKARIPATKPPRGRHVLLVHKPERSQTQLGVALLGPKLKDPHWFPFLVGDAAFGGMFTSRLVQEVRAKRGWSYSAYSQLSVATQRDAWRMWSHPAVENAPACAALQLELLEAWHADGLSPGELRRAKRYLVGSRCFEEDTAARRLDHRLSAALYGVDQESPATNPHLGGYRRAIRGVTRKAVHEAVAKRLDPRHLLVVAVGDATRLEAPFAKLPGVRSVEVVPFDARL